MSSQNVEVVQRLIGALNRGDVDDLVSRFYSPDAEFIPAMQAALEGTVYRGSAEIRAYYDEIYGVWEDFRVEATGVRDFGDTVLAVGRVIARGKASGVGLDRSWSFLFRLLDGKVVWHRNFLDPAEARRAAELPDVP